MSQSLKQSMTEERLRKLGQEFDALKRQINILASAPAATPGYQMLGGNPVFPNGFGVGGQSVYEPTVVPAATALTATWTASWDTIGINLSWTAPSGVGADQIVSYVVQVKKHGSILPPIEQAVSGTSIRVEPVEPNTVYDITVSAMTRFGRLANPATATVTTGGDTTPPAAPTFPASPVTVAINGLSVKWNANTERDVANGAGQYRVVVSTSSALTSPAFDAKVSGTNLYVTPLVAGTAYYVGVYAIDSSGNQSTVGTPTGGPFTPLANVTDTSALAIGGGNVVKNSGFESPTALESWTQIAACSLDASTSHGSFGTKSLLFSGSADAAASQTITLSAGTWILSGWVKATSVASVSGSPLGVVLNTAWSGGTVSGFTALMGGTISAGGNIVVAGFGTFDWKRLAMKFTVTSPTISMTIYPQRGSGGSCSGSAWFDEIQLEQGTTITAYAPRADEILASTIGSTQITDNAVITSKLAAFSVVAGKVAANTIGATEIIARSITAAQIAVDTLTANEIAAGAITANELAANSVSAAHIQANTITAGQIAANTIIASNLAVALGLSVGQFIQSSNFVSGPAGAGWRIDGAGNAELNNASIRGTLQAARFGGSPFDFVAYDGHNGIRIVASGGDAKIQFGDQITAGGSIGWTQGVSRIDFDAGPGANSPAWKFSSGDVQFTNKLIHDTYFEFWQDGIQVATHRNVGGANETRFPLVPVIAGNTAIINTSSWQLGYSTSSGRFKHNVTELDPDLGGEANPVFRLAPRHFEWNADIVERSGPGSGQRQTGLIAEEVAALIPNGVHIGDDGLPRALNETTLIAHLIDAVSYLKQRIDA